MISPANICLQRTSTPLGAHISDNVAYFVTLDYMVDVEAALYSISSLFPTQCGCYVLASYHRAAESLTFEAVDN